MVATVTQEDQVFSYRPLTEQDSLRLILLHPALHESLDVRCDLVYSTLSHFEHSIIHHYTALSYVWGDATTVRIVWMENSPFNVRTNLYSALRDMRDKTNGVLLWVDALCINQSDYEEKAKQVGMMGKIFATAAHTIIYLGPMESGEETLLGKLIQENSSSSAVSSQVSNDLQVADFILGKAWFRRVWIFQELVLSRHPYVQCGQYRWTWEYLYNFLEEQKKLISPILGTTSSRETEPGTRVLEETLQGYKLLSGMQLARTRHLGRMEEEDGLAILDVLSSRRGLEVTDPRDMIYAHLSFVSDLEHRHPDS